MYAVAFVNSGIGRSVRFLLEVGLLARWRRTRALSPEGGGTPTEESFR